MEAKIGQIVISKAGHDKGEAFVIISADGKICNIVNGKSRKLENPKKKKAMHLMFTNSLLTTDETKTNRQIIKALAKFRNRVQET